MTPITAIIQHILQTLQNQEDVIISINPPIPEECLSDPTWLKTNYTDCPILATKINIPNYIKTLTSDSFFFIESRKFGHGPTNATLSISITEKSIKTSKIVYPNGHSWPDHHHTEIDWSDPELLQKIEQLIN